jgi:hypothetical protein
MQKGISLKRALLVGSIGLATGTVFVLAVVAAPEKAAATGPFATATGQQCDFCHVAGTQGARPPQLNSNGEYYRTNCLPTGSLALCW